MLHILILFLSFTMHAMEQLTLVKETPLKEKHKRWVKNQTAAHPLETSDDEQEEKFKTLAISEKPWPEAFQVYLEGFEEGDIALVEDPALESLKIIRVYGSKKGQPHYVTVGPLDAPARKETFTVPRSSASNKQNGKSRSAITGTSFSYPNGCVAYHYVSPEGLTIQFHRGHGIPHKDTNLEADINSDTDPENFVPQNVTYNSPVRRDLEARFAKNNINYKEISVYYKDTLYTVTADKKKLSVPIPEGFLLLAYDKAGEIKEVYYFPNFIDYQALKKSAEMEYKEFPEFFRLTRLKKFIYIPVVHKKKVKEHIKKIDLLKKLMKRLLKNSESYFSRFTEEQMPPKARVALLTMLLEKHMQSIASLEFVTFEYQLTLIHFYTIPRRLLQFDCRTEQQKELMFNGFLKDASHSKTAKKILRFLKKRVSFLELQKCVYEIIEKLEQNRASFGALWDLKAISDPEYIHYSIDIIDESAFLRKFDASGTADNLAFNLYDIDVKSDLPAMKELIGGFDPCNDDTARAIMEIVDNRLQERRSANKERLHLLWLYHNCRVLRNAERETFWKKKLIEENGEHESFIYLWLLTHAIDLEKNELSMQSFH